MVRILEGTEEEGVRIEKADLSKDRECFSVPLDHRTERYLAGRERGIELERGVFLWARFTVGTWEGDRWSRNRPQNGKRPTRAVIRAEGTIYLSKEAWVEYVTHLVRGWYRADHWEVRARPILRQIFEADPLRHCPPVEVRVTCVRDEEYPRATGCVKAIFPSFIFRRVSGEEERYDKVVRSIVRERGWQLPVRSLHWYYTYCVDNPVSYGIKACRIRAGIFRESTRDHEGGRDYGYETVFGVPQRVF